MSARTASSRAAAVAEYRTIDGKRVVSIVQSSGGYRFVEDRELWEPPSDGMSGYSYWAETEHSGIYATPEEALVAAKEALPWLAS